MKSIEEKERLRELLKCVEKIFKTNCEYLDNFEDFTVIEGDEWHGEEITITNQMYKEILIVDNVVINVNATSVETIAEIACIECLYQNNRMVRSNYFGFIGRRV